MHKVCVRTDRYCDVYYTYIYTNTNTSTHTHTHTYTVWLSC